MRSRARSRLTAHTIFRSRCGFFFVGVLCPPLFLKSVNTIPIIRPDHIRPQNHSVTDGTSHSTSYFIRAHSHSHTWAPGAMLDLAERDLPLERDLPQPTHSLRPLIPPKKARPPFDGDASLVVAQGLARAWGASCGHLRPECYDRVLSLSKNQRCLLRPGPDPNPGT